MEAEKEKKVTLRGHASQTKKIAHIFAPYFSDNNVIYEAPNASPLLPPKMLTHLPPCLVYGVRPRYHHPSVTADIG